MSLLSFIGPLLLYVDLKPLEAWFICLLFSKQWVLLVQRYFLLAFTSNFLFHRYVSAAVGRCFLSGLTAVTSAAGELVEKRLNKEGEQNEKAVLKILSIQTVVVMGRNRLLSPSVLRYCRSQAEVSTAAEDMEKLASEVVSQF